MTRAQELTISALLALPCALTILAVAYGLIPDIG